MATGLTQAAVAMVRLSGPEAWAIVRKLARLQGSYPTPRTATLMRIYGEALSGIQTLKNAVLDEAIVILYQAPASYTGEDVAEITLHASPYIVRSVLELSIAHGARMAEPGEFTERAFLNGKLDLAEAEGVNDLIHARTRAQQQQAMGLLQGGLSKEVAILRDRLLHLATLLELELDFSEEDVEFASRTELLELATSIQTRCRELAATFSRGEAIRSGMPVVIVGRPNAGKSTLLNHLLGEERAIVTEIAGTTRDTIEGECVFSGLLFRFADTAGLRDTEDPVEIMGIARTLEHAKRAKLLLVLVDASSPEAERVALELFQELDGNAQKALLLTKADRVPDSVLGELRNRLVGQLGDVPVLPWSSVSQGGDAELKGLLDRIATETLPEAEEVVVTNLRHYQALAESDGELTQLLAGLQSGLSQELLAFHLRRVIAHLGAITGEIGVEDILGNIFQNFCIGK